MAKSEVQIKYGGLLKVEISGNRTIVTRDNQVAWSRFNRGEAAKSLKVGEEEGVSDGNCSVPAMRVVGGKKSKPAPKTAKGGKSAKAQKSEAEAQKPRRVKSKRFFDDGESVFR